MKLIASIKSGIGIKILLLVAYTTSLSFAETVGLFYDASIAQHVFAGSDIKNALEKKGLTVEIKTLSTLVANYAGKKVVIALKANASAMGVMTGESGAAVPSLGSEAYAIRTTTTPQLSYWVFGGDENGAMYGGLQVAENISFNGFTGNVNTEEAPYVEVRGIKFNIPLDERAPTYYSASGGTSHKLAIEHVWDIKFWNDWFDEMARHRYNFLTLWTNHPFTSLLNMPEYKDVAIQNIQGFNGYSKVMSIDQKVQFWKEVMQRAHDRGFRISFNIWNLFLDGAEGKYGITKDQNNAATKTYLRKAMTALFETYPNLSGFGLTAGEAMTGSNEERAKFTFETYGQGMLDVASKYPDRKFIFVHRQHNTSASAILANFKPLIALKNCRVDLSQKYSQAHMHGAPVPDYLPGDYLSGLSATGLKTWFTVRNDDFYFLPWGDPEFIREYIAGWPDKDKYVAGVYIGSDGWVFTREVFSKSPFWKGKLSIQKTWYMQKLWGRLLYNPKTPNDLFKNHLAATYPQVSGPNLFDAWTKVSHALHLGIEQVTGSWDLDFHFWPEGWLANINGVTYQSLNNTKAAVPMDGSKLCSMANTASGKCGTTTSAIVTTDSMENLAKSALATLNAMSDGGNEQLRLNLYDLKAMSYLSLYGANKYRAAIFLNQNKSAEAKTAMGNAYCNWMQYTEIMNTLYLGPGAMQRVSGLMTDWHAVDKLVLADFNKDAGGSGTPSCTIVPVGVKANAPSLKKTVTETWVYTMQGKLVTIIKPGPGLEGKSLEVEAPELRALPEGLYFTIDKAQNQNLGKPKLYIAR
jgi:hypothetical protein